jgi:hypothetical protein
MTIAEAISDDGIVVGYYYPLGSRVPVIWIPEGGTYTMYELPTLGGYGGQAMDINRKAQVVGQSADATGMWPITVWNVNLPPVIPALGSYWLTAGDTADFYVGATDPNGDQIVYGASNLPTGAKLDATGHFTWTTRSSDAGSYTVTFTASDGSTTSAEQMQFTVFESTSGQQLKFQKGGTSKKTAVEVANQPRKVAATFEPGKDLYGVTYGVTVTLTDAVPPDKVTLSVTTFTDCTGVADGFKIDNTCFDVVAGGVLTYTSAQVCVNYNAAVNNSFKLLHYEPNSNKQYTWVDRTTSRTDTVVCATVQSLSPIILGIDSVPVVEQVLGPASPVPIGAEAKVEATFSDRGEGCHTASMTWGDATSSTANVSETCSADAGGTATAWHSYSVPGVYTVAVTVTDSRQMSGQGEYRYIVVFDPNGGFVTGGGWVLSPEGAYALDPNLTGRATFGFVAKYVKGASTPIGQTQFQFQVAGLRFQSSTYDWLVVAGSKAQYKGSGTINGTGDYRFLLSAVDGDRPGGGGVDKFRIKIWDRSTAAVIYDNMTGADDDAAPTTALGGGSIVIHSAQ